MRFLTALAFCLAVIFVAPASAGEAGKYDIAGIKLDTPALQAKQALEQAGWVIATNSTNRPRIETRSIDINGQVVFTYPTEWQFEKPGTNEEIVVRLAAPGTPEEQTGRIIQIDYYLDEGAGTDVWHTATVQKIRGKYGEPTYFTDCPDYDNWGAKWQFGDIVVPNETRYSLFAEVPCHAARIKIQLYEYDPTDLRDTLVDILLNRNAKPSSETSF